MNKILQFLNWMFSYLSPLGRGAKGGVGIHTDKNTIIATQPVTLHNQLSTINRKPSTNFFFLLFTVYCSLLTAQNFPVQVIPQVIPPAPIYVSDYADASTISSPLRVQIILNDFEIANREIRLKTYFTGSGVNFQSNDIVVGASPLFLEGGVPLVLTNVELAPYFEFNNISGITPNQYGSAIPEGAYQFCVEVYDVLTGSRLSNKSCAVSVVFQNEPPFLVLPRNKTNVDEVNPQYIVFQWTPRSINVSNVEYELSLVEVWDNQVDPQQAFLSSPPIFQTTTSATTYVYGPSDLQLLSGKNYAWRIQAKAKQGTEEIGLFKNQGYSEIFSFSYAGACELPFGIDHEVKGSTNANIFWDDFSTDIPEYTIRYRQKNSATSENEWFFNKTNSNNTTLWDLKAGGTYEYQLQNTCAVAESQWSVVKQFTTFIADDEDSVYDCNISPDFNITNRELLPNMGVGDKFTAGDFPITVQEVNGSNGRFNGKGYVTIPYLSSIKVGVQFTNIEVNTDNQLIEGEIITMYDPTLSNILDIDDAIDTVNDVVDSVGEFFEGDNDLDEIQVDWTIGSKDEITIEDGMVVITNPNNGVTTKESLGDDMIITDQEGNTYYVDPDGNITEGGQITPGGEVNSGNVTGVSNNGDLQSLTAENIIVKFNTKGTYGFDIMPTTASAKLKSEYKTIKDVNGNDYVLAHHAVKNGGTTQIQATIEIQNNAYTPDQVVFKNKQGKIFTPTSINGNTATISLDGVYSFENETIYAVVPSKEDANRQLTAGAFTLWHLADRVIDVVLVSVNGASLGNIESTVQSIYQKGVATINFGAPLQLSVTPSSLGTNGLDVGDSAWLGAYNDEQKQLVTAVQNLDEYRNDAYYVLVFGDISPSRSIAGFMPLQRQMGFVFSGSADEEGKGGDKGKVLAHELGHGVFALQHPSSQYGADLEDTTDWLMDGGNETVLPHTHWAQIHDPALKFYIFQKEEDGELAGKIWFTPNWEPIQIENTATVISTSSSARIKGTLPGFKLSGVNYLAKFYENGSFRGYFKEIDVSFSDPYNIKDIAIPESEKKVYLFEKKEDECNVAYESNYGYVITNKASINYSTSNTNLTKTDIVKCTNETNIAFDTDPFSKSICELIGEQNSFEGYVKNAAKNLDAAFDKRRSISSDIIPNKSDYTHLVNLSVNLKGKANIIEDKLFLLKERTDVNFYVLFENVASKLSLNARNEFAAQILAESKIPKSEKTVLIVVPFLTTPDGTNCIQTGFAQSDSGIIEQTYITKFNNAPGLFEATIEIFKGVEKPLELYYNYVHADRHVEIVPKKANQNVKGQPFIQTLVVLKSNKFEELRNFEDEKPILEEQKENEDDFDYYLRRQKHSKDLIKWSIEYEQLLAEARTHDTNAILNSATTSAPAEGFTEVENQDGLQFREPYITSESVENGLMRSYAELHLGKSLYSNTAVTIAYFLGDDAIEQVKPKHLYEEIDANSLVYEILDVTSLVLSPLALDFIPDTIGVAYAVYNKDYVQAGLSSVSLAAVGITQYAAYLSRSKRFKLIAEIAEDGSTVSYSIKEASASIDVTKQVEVFPSKAKDIDAAKIEISEEFGLEFGDEVILKIDAVVDAGEKLSRSNLLTVQWANNITGFRSSTSALEIWNNIDKEFRHFVDGDFYIKFDEQTGDLLFGNHKTGEFLGLYEGDLNIQTVQDNGLNRLFSKLKAYHGVGTSSSYVNLNVSSGANIIANPEKTATIVGNFKRFPWEQGDMRELIPELLGDLKTQQFGPKRGGFNVLNVADEVVSDWDTFWVDFNLPWINQAIERGDDIWAASNPMELNLLFKNLDNVPVNNIQTPEDLTNYLKNLTDEDVLSELTGFGNEVKALSNSDYVYDPSVFRFIKNTDLAKNIFSTAELALLKRADLSDFVSNNLDDLLLAENRTAIWALNNVSSGQFKRGDLIEEIFNQWGNKYGDYQNLNDIIPNYRTLDFDGVLANVNEVVSLKTFKPLSNNTLSNFKSTVRSNMKKLNDDVAIGTNHTGKSRVLDFTIEKGAWSQSQIDDVYEYIYELLDDELKFGNLSEVRITEF